MRTEKTNWPMTAFFLAPAAFLLVVFLVYPAIYTILLSFARGRNGLLGEWVGLDNYARVFADPDFFALGIPPSGALWNNILWIVFYTSFVVFLGLIIAVVASRVRYESVVKAVVFLPMAIAATALAVIWKFVYAPDADLGVLNAMLGAIGIGPIPWLGSPQIVNAALIAAGVWGPSASPRSSCPPPSRGSRPRSSKRRASRERASGRSSSASSCRWSASPCRWWPSRSS
jgi:ABC-type sugar transport system permease subunit